MQSGWAEKGKLEMAILEFGQQLGRVTVAGAVEKQDTENIVTVGRLANGSFLEPLGTELNEMKQ